MTALNLARPDDVDRLLPLVAAFHTEMGITSDEERRRAALLPLLEGSPYGAIYTVGPMRAPIGYVVITFGWSVEFGGLDGWIDELYIRPGVRGRGLGTEVLTNLPKALAAAGLRGLSLEVKRDDEKTRAFYERAKFQMRDGFALMSRLF